MPDARFAHHHVHTEYSPWDAPVGLKRLLDYSKDIGYRTVTVTDHGTVGSWVKLAYMSKERGLKPIFGIEAYFTPDRKIKTGGRNSYHIVLIAKNKHGIRNIFRMSQLAYTEGFYYDPRIDWELLEKHSEGVICTTSCVSGLVPYTLRLSPEDPSLSLTKGGEGKPAFIKPYDAALEHAKRFQRIFKQDFYTEVQYHGIPEVEQQAYGGVSKIAAELGLKTVGTNDVHYLRKEDANTQEIMMALNLGRCIRDPGRIRHGTNHFYLKNPEEMIELFGGKDSKPVQGAIEIAEICNAELEMGKTQLPSVDIPKEYKNDLDYLEALSRDGLRRIGKEGDPIYEARFKDELDVVRRLREKGKQFDRYFLIVWDYVRWAWENGIRVGVGRGSGCGSLLLYCLRITGIDPIPLDLLFERFLAEDRNEMPDIDIDFDAEKGSKVYEYVCSKYGINRCARIGNLQTFHVASALKAAFKVFDPCSVFEAEMEAKKKSDHAKKIAKNQKSSKSQRDDHLVNETARLANQITKMLPKNANGMPSDKCTLLKEVYDKNPEERIYVYDDPQFVDLKRNYPEIFKFAEDIEGLVKDRSVHAAGVLITNDELVDVCPQQFAGTKQNLATVFDMLDVDRLGGVKFDFLFTRVLSIISRCVDTIEAGYGKKIDIDNLTPDDPKVLSIFTKGDTLAIFQFESRFMRDILRDMKCSCFEDVIAANAMGRPGPMQFIPKYCARKNGHEAVTYPVGSLEQVLKPTFGITVYQEQVMKIVRILAGFTGSEADKVRKAMGKKKKDVLDAMKDKFIKGCIGNKSCTEAVANQLWQQLEEFSKYAFNKSHSAGYSYTAYQCAYLKAYYPAEFMAAQLTVEGGASEYDTIKLYESGTKDMGIKVLDLCINDSKGDYQVVDLSNGKKAVRRGFKGIPGIGMQAYADIVKAQPYKDIYDYCMRAGEGAKSNIAMALIDAQAFGCFLDKLNKQYERRVTNEDLRSIYEKHVRRASIEKKVKGGRKVEKESMGIAFGADNEAPSGTKKNEADFVLEI